MNKFVKAWDNSNLEPIDIRNLSKDRNGVKCNCSCVECKEPVEACQGNIRSWYFRHQSSSDCRGGSMTALHLMAQFLLKGNHIIKTKKGEVSYTDGINEFTIPNSLYSADVAGYKQDGSTFLIEIFVKHQLSKDDNKFKFINKQQLHTIEIDLSEIDPEIDNETLLNILLTDISIQNEIYVPNIKEDRSMSFFEWLLLGVGAFYVGRELKKGMEKLLKKKKKRRNSP